MSKLTLMTGVNIESEYNYGHARKEKEIEYMYYTLRTTEDFYAFQDIIHFNYAGLSQTQKNIFDKLGGMSTTEFIGYRVESKKCFPVTICLVAILPHSPYCFFLYRYTNRRIFIIS